jgi:hypothetical protein
MLHLCLLVLSFPFLLLASGGSTSEPASGKKDEAVRTGVDATFPISSCVLADGAKQSFE